MPLQRSTRLGPYEIAGALGAGGMGEVYRATDTNLKRQVAIKVLPTSMAADPDRLARFQREAEVLAALNHPNIAHIHGLEKSGGILALVMELIEGPTLADRIAEGAVAWDEALPIAKQIAAALAAAHEQGIIHRDLKPANIKVRSDGTVKVLDFGLAKAMEPAGSMSADASMSPTITSPALMTGAGVILGTAAYMSPEQARGKAVDKRTDIWAFGCVLFEMVTGRRPFAGEDTTEVLGAVVHLEPSWDALPPDVPPPVRTLLHGCLAKDPGQRVGDISIARFVLDKAASLAAPPTTFVTPAPSRPGRERLVSIAALAIAGTAIVALAIPTTRYLRQTPPPETRTDIVTPATNRLASFALSPDGRQIAFVASGDGTSRLWLRSLATTTAQPLAGTEGARLPFWSPDSRSIGFFAAGTLKRLDVGGAVQTLAPAISGCGGTWRADGVIVFAPGTTNPLMRVSANGGDAVAVTALGPRQQSHRAPQLLPDGRILFYVQGTPDTAGVYLGALDGSPPIRLMPSESSAVLLPAGSGSAGGFREGRWLLWVRAGTLVAQRMDMEQTALTGEPIPLADGVAVNDHSAAVSVSTTGLVAYRTGPDSQRQLTWVNRSGTAAGTIGDADRSNLANPRLSPDGRRVAVNRAVRGNVDIWLMDGARTTRVTFDAALDVFPVWSPDGARMVFRSNRADQADLYEKHLSGAGVEERLVASNQLKTPLSWSSDGRFLLYLSIDPQTAADLWVVPMVGPRTPSVFLKTPFRETNAAFSPNGQWVAYQSNESGRPEIYVRPFIPPGAAPGTAAGQSQISTTGGVMPVWRSDGKELFYVNPAGELMAAPIAFTKTALEPGTPMRLFATRIVFGGGDVQQWWQYDVASDGRFLINNEIDSVATPITLLTNWSPAARE